MHDALPIFGPAVAKIANELQRDVLLHARHLFLLTVEAESFKDTVSCLVGDGAKSRLRAKAVAYPDTISARRSEEHTSDLQSLMRISYAVFCLKKKTQQQKKPQHTQ